MTKSKNDYINEYEIFRLSDKINIKLDIKELGKSKTPCVIVDNFYKNPEKVRDLALSLPYTKSKYVLNYSPGKRCRLILDTKHIENVCKYLLKKFIQTLPYKSNAQDVGPQTIFQKINGDEVLQAVQTNPHIDGYDKLQCAMVLYLNTEEECRGGTAFYRHKATGLELIKTEKELKSTYKNGRKHYVDFVTDSNDGWELIELIPMKFNRMIVYPPNIFHSGYIKRDDFLEYDRLTQLGFF